MVKCKSLFFEKFDSFSFVKPCNLYPSFKVILLTHTLILKPVETVLDLGIKATAIPVIHLTYKRCPLVDRSSE